MASEARVHVLAHALNRAALAGRVAPLEEQKHALAVRTRPLLHFHQFDLQRKQMCRVLPPADLPRCRKLRMAPLVTRKVS